MEHHRLVRKKIGRYLQLYRYDYGSHSSCNGFKTAFLFEEKILRIRLGTNAEAQFRVCTEPSTRCERGPKSVDLLIQIVQLLSHGFDARQASPRCRISRIGDRNF